MSVRLAVLGAGRIGRVHARAIAGVRAAELVAVYDPLDDAAQAVVRRYGGTVRSLDAIEGADDVGAVVICTPTDLHAELIERFARAGKAIFCEKPIALDVERTRQALAVVEACHGTLMLGFQRRFDPDFRALKQAIDDGRIGRVELVVITSRDPAPPPYDYIERSGGLFRDMTIHDFDVARWLLDEEIDTVQASASVLVDPEIGRRGDVDSATVLLRTASGRLCTIVNSRRASDGYDQRIEVHGSSGSVSVGNVHRANIIVADASGYARPPLLDFFMTRYLDAYAAEIEAFVAAVESGDPPPVGGRDGLAALLLADAALSSVGTGEAVRPERASI